MTSEPTTAQYVVSLILLAFAVIGVAATLNVLINWLFKHVSLSWKRKK